MATSEASALMRESRAAVTRAQALRDEMAMLRQQVTSEACQVRDSVAALMSAMQRGRAFANGHAPAAYPGVRPAIRRQADSPVSSPISAEDQRRLNLLTAREIEVLRLIGEGERTKEIAFLLGITFKTAVTHRSNIMEKLGIHEGPRLVRFAIRTGICRA